VTHYLSIDLDYWLRKIPLVDIAESELRNTVKRAQRRGIPLLAVMNHQQLLPEVNASSARKLVNVDQHSDLTSADIDNLECGTWVSYVRWRHEGEYLWLRSDRRLFIGACNGGNRWDWETDWKRVRSEYRAVEVASLVDRHCAGVGLCMSPFYAQGELEEVFRRVVRDFGVFYRKGRRREDTFGRKVRPPRAA